MAFLPEPRSATAAVLLCNLGTPDAPTPAAVRRYLAEFLSDPRVVEIPRAVWLPMLHGVILPLRSAKSAAKYATIWTPEGSPLKVWTERQAKRCKAGWAKRAPRAVAYAMRYGNPSIASQLDALAPPAPPASWCCRLSAVLGHDDGQRDRRVAPGPPHARNVPELRFVNRYHDDRGYIDGAGPAHRAPLARERPARPLVMSFHGVPERTLHLGDPYHCECQKTARLLAEWLQLAPASTP
jgi:ferrochelatase